VTWRSLPGEPIVVSQNVVVVFISSSGPARRKLAFAGSRRFRCGDQIRIAGVCREISGRVTLELTLSPGAAAAAPRREASVSRQIEYCGAHIDVGWR
jgi:hypothetical protein